MLNTQCRMQLDVMCNLFYATTQICSCMCRMQLNFSCKRQLQNLKFLLVVLAKTHLDYLLSKHFSKCINDYYGVTTMLMYHLENTSQITPLMFAPWTRLIPCVKFLPTLMNLKFKSSKVNYKNPPPKLSINNYFYTKTMLPQ